MLKSYKELIVWQKSIQLVKEIYKLTNLLPTHEQYVLTAQMRRCSISIPSNIAEGYNRRNSAEYIQFLAIANASSYELETQIIIMKNIYTNIKTDMADKILDEIQKMLMAMIRKIPRYKLTPHPSPLTPK